MVITYSRIIGQSPDPHLKVLNPPLPPLQTPCLSPVINRDMTDSVISQCMLCSVFAVFDNHVTFDLKLPAFCPLFLLCFSGGQWAVFPPLSETYLGLYLSLCFSSFYFIHFLFNTTLLLSTLLCALKLNLPPDITLSSVPSFPFFLFFFPIFLHICSVL